MKYRAAVLEPSARMTAVTWEPMERAQRAGCGWLPGVMPLCATVMLGASGLRFGGLGHGFHWI